MKFSAYFFFQSKPNREYSRYTKKLSLSIGEISLLLTFCSIVNSRFSPAIVLQASVFHLFTMLCFHDRVVCKRRGVASLSHPITIRRRYRGFTSLWPRRDSKVSTPLLRTRQNGLRVRRVFRIPPLNRSSSRPPFMRHRSAW